MEVTREEFHHSFFKHLQVYRSAQTGTGPSHWLLLAYAVECGLKVVIMKNENMFSTEEFSSQSLKSLVTGQDGHNLERLATHAGFTSNILKKNIRCKPVTTRQRNACSRDLHIVWRYGVSTEPTDEKPMIQELERIANWVEVELAP